MEAALNLKQKTDNVLVADLKALVVKERETLTEILNYLIEVENRRIYLARGYSSLFAFLTSELGYSESAAQRRIEGMRLLRDLPEAEEKIEKGELSLTVASQVQVFFRQENQKRKEQKAKPISREEKLNLLANLQGTSSRECEKKLADFALETIIPKEKTRPLPQEKTLIQFTAGKELMSKINKLKSLLSHRNKTGSLEALFEELASIALEKLDPERRQQRREHRQSKKFCSPTLSPPAPEVSGVIARPNGPKQSFSASTKSRYIPQPLHDQIWIRDQGQCQHRDLQTGKLCGSNQKLELDHKFPYALGGESSVANLQLRCQAHNQWRAGMMFENH
jgi:5-methylcytosine-specific restriction endonuclease McrA